MQFGFSRTLQELTMKIEELEILRGLYLKLRGDGKRYQFRCRMGNDFDEVSYSYYFVAKNVDWQEVRLSFRDFVPTYRGKILESFQSLDSQEIRSLGLMISDKQVGYYHLEIA